jgi:hypothetical protein
MATPNLDDSLRPLDDSPRPRPSMTTPAPDDVDPKLLREAEYAGLDIGCVLAAGGANILSVIVRCLPALRDGPEAFREALVEALGPDGVDMVTKVMRCIQ